MSKRIARKGPPQVVWVSPERFGDQVDMTPRHLRRLEEFGLPSRTRGRGREYPIPDALVWLLAYKQRIMDRSGGRWGEHNEFISMNVAWAEHIASTARLTADLDRRRGHRPPRPRYDAQGRRFLEDDESVWHRVVE